MLFLTPASPSTASAPAPPLAHLGANWPAGPGTAQDWRGPGTLAQPRTDGEGREGGGDVWQGPAEATQQCGAPPGLDASRISQP